MFISDAHDGMVRAMGSVFPDAHWQRCQFHFTRNITAKAPQKYQAGLSAELQEMFYADSLGETQKIRDTILEEYRDVAESAMECLENGFSGSMTVMVLLWFFLLKFLTFQEDLHAMWKSADTGSL